MIPTVLNPMGLDDRQPLTLTALSASSSVTLNATGSPVVSGLKYRTRSGSWQTYTPGTTVPLSAVGDYVQFWNTAGQLSTGNSNYAQFAMTGTIAGSGNVQSLLNFSRQAPNSCFIKLFQSCAALTTAPELPAASLADNCYAGMFRDCLNLESNPSILPAMIMAKNCCQLMFSGCYNISKIPELPATTLAENCYSAMFSYCSKIASVSELPATTLVANCYHSMFYGCSNLKEINVNFTDWNASNNATTDWVKSISASGTFSKPSALSEEYGTGRIPTGWTIINK